MQNIYKIEKYITRERFIKDSTACTSEPILGYGATLVGSTATNDAP